ncbi:MAG: type II toxin-antitoxin system RelE/ParE family toxin [Deltaproteobacteria bacterium]|nr:type II toxin-antitoxin system RelE/ParE family toxin [Deltaproteobacteria bacterium]
MDVYFKSPFRKFVKKQARPFQLIIEDEVDKIVKNPGLGDLRKGDLAGFRVHKFYYQDRIFLISYRLRESELNFFTVGTHENFYRELKRYVKEAGES